MVEIDLEVTTAGFVNFSFDEIVYDFKLERIGRRYQESMFVLNVEDLASDLESKPVLCHIGNRSMSNYYLGSTDEKTKTLLLWDLNILPGYIFDQHESLEVPWLTIDQYMEFPNLKKITSNISEYHRLPAMNLPKFNKYAVPDLNYQRLEGRDSEWKVEFIDAFFLRL